MRGLLITCTLAIAAAVPGFYVGFSLLAPDGEATVRLDVTWHTTMPVSSGEDGLALLTVGVAVAFSSRHGPCRC